MDKRTKIMILIGMMKASGLDFGGVVEGIEGLANLLKSIGLEDLTISELADIARRASGKKTKNLDDNVFTTSIKQ